MIVIDNDDEDEEDETFAGFMSSHLNSKMDSFQNSLLKGTGMNTSLSLLSSCVLLNDG